MSIEKPKAVKKAMAEGDTRFLQRLGSLGGRHAAEANHRRKDEKAELLADAKAHEDAFHTMNKEGDVVPPPFAT
jgi:hypothetical protein